MGGTEAPEERQTRGPAVTKFAGAGREAGPARVLILNRGPAFIGGLFSPDYGEGSSRGTSGEFGYARARRETGPPRKPRAGGDSSYLPARARSDFHAKTLRISPLARVAGGGALDEGKIA